MWKCAYGEFVGFYMQFRITYSLNTVEYVHVYEKQILEFIK